MTAPVSNPDGTKQKFVPKRRTPYLLQKEVIHQGLNKSLGSMPSPAPSLDDSNKKGEERPIVRVISQGTINKLEGLSCSDNRIDTKVNYHEEVSKLCGIQKRIVEYFVGCCMVRGDVITGVLSRLF